MITNWPLVFFTVFSQLGTGLALFAWWKDHHGDSPSAKNWQTSGISAAVATVVAQAGSVDEVYQKARDMGAV